MNEEDIKKVKANRTDTLSKILNCLDRSSQYYFQKMIILAIMYGWFHQYQTILGLSLIRRSHLISYESKGLVIYESSLTTRTVAGLKDDTDQIPERAMVYTNTAVRIFACFFSALFAKSIGPHKFIIVVGIMLLQFFCILLDKTVMRQVTAMLTTTLFTTIVTVTTLEWAFNYFPLRYAGPTFLMFETFRLFFANMHIMLFRIGYKFSNVYILFYITCFLFGSVCYSMRTHSLLHSRVRNEMDAIDEIVSKVTDNRKTRKVLDGLFFTAYVPSGILEAWFIFIKDWRSYLLLPCPIALFILNQCKPHIYMWRLLFPMSILDAEISSNCLCMVSNVFTISILILTNAKTGIVLSLTTAISCGLLLLSVPVEKGRFCDPSAYMPIHTLKWGVYCLYLLFCVSHYMAEKFLIYYLYTNLHAVLRCYVAPVFLSVYAFDLIPPFYTSKGTLATAFVGTNVVSKLITALLVTSFLNLRNDEPKFALPFPKKKSDKHVNSSNKNK